jgi:cob(I)alamin adenosyltransferase
VEARERWIDAAEAELEPLKRFILPGGAQAAAALPGAHRLPARGAAGRRARARGATRPPE